jgi:hypothetical protein
MGAEGKEETTRSAYRVRARRRTACGGARERNSASVAAARAGSSLWKVRRDDDMGRHVSFRGRKEHGLGRFCGENQSACEGPRSR